MPKPKRQTGDLKDECQKYDRPKQNEEGAIGIRTCCEETIAAIPPKRNAVNAER
jgi:hypothetical protein